MRAGKQQRLTNWRNVVDEKEMELRRKLETLNQLIDDVGAR